MLSATVPENRTVSWSTMLIWPRSDSRVSSRVVPVEQDLAGVGVG